MGSPFKTSLACIIVRGKRKEGELWDGKSFPAIVNRNPNPESAPRDSTVEVNNAVRTGITHTVKSNVLFSLRHQDLLQSEPFSAMTSYAVFKRCARQGISSCMCC